MKEAHKLAVALACGLMLAGCGGGGGGAGTTTPTGGGGGGGGTTSTNTFTAEAAYKARITNGASDNFTVTGSCNGTATISTPAAAAFTFEGTAGVAATQTLTANFTSCFPNSVSSIVTYYFDANGTPIGANGPPIGAPLPGTYYVKLSAAPTALPAGVKVGDSGTIGNYTIYSDSNKTTQTGSRTVTWAVEADTATTAIVKITIKDSNTANALVSTEEDSYRIDANGALTVVTIKVVAGVLNLTLTKS